MTNLARTYRLLVVDDDPVLLRLYRALLSQLPGSDVEIVQATTGALGLAALRQRKFDCLLLDFELPDMTGLEFMTHSADADGEQPCAVILVTAKGSQAIAVAAMKHGARDYLTKDRVGAGSLWRAITQAVTQTELRRRLADLVRERTEANAALEREVAAHEITEAALRTAKEAAEQANQAKTRFVAMVTHELRTPLNGVLGYVELSRMEGGLSPRQMSRLDAAARAGRHLRDMIESVLDFASIEAGRLELRTAPIRLEPLIQDCMAIIGPIAADRALGLRVSIAPGAPEWIIGDLGRMRQILINLLGNALKFTREGSVELRVLAGIHPGEARIEVADTGPGIEPARRERLFHDFERLNASEHIEGTGLGLAITARIVTLMGGTIGYAANPGGGSIFYLDLPAGDPDPEAPPVMPPAEPARPRRLRVLLVDDVAMNLDVIGAFLGAAGHAVTLASGGAEAVRFATHTMFDLILMDVCMPEPDGLAATRLIRALPAPHGEVPILALTARSFVEQQASCRDAGMNGHVSKPVDYATLMRAIAEVSAGVARDPTAVSSDPGPTDAPPRMDQAILDETLAYLSPGESIGHFRLLRGHMEQMARLLDPPDDQVTLRDAAHALASTAGMFGFKALSTASRGLETAIRPDTPAPAMLVESLRTEIQEALAILTRLTRETRMELA